MNLLDKVIAALNPAAGLRRARLRTALHAYAAGEQSLRHRAWRAADTGPNAEIEGKLPTLRARSRQLVRDNPYAARLIEIQVGYQIGTGIVARFQNAKVQAMWDRWADRCDYDGHNNLYGLMALAARARAEGGEALIRIRHLTVADARARGLDVPVALQVLEGDYLPDQDAIGAPARVVQGIEFGPDGRRVAYHLRDRHPGESDALHLWDTTTTRVPAHQIIHLYRKLRPGQIRGVPDLTPILLRLKQVDDLEDATLDKFKAEALLGVFLTSPDPIDTPVEKGPDGRAVLELYPGMVHNLPPGTEPKFLQPSGAGAFEPYALHHLMAIAAGGRVAYDQMTGDMRQGNYSSLRASRLDQKRLVEQDQWNMIIPVMCQPIAREFARAVELAQGVSMDAMQPEWQPPRFEMLDPHREIGAIVTAIRSGLETWPQAVASFGYDPARQADEIAASNERLDDLGVVLDCDPRRVARSGTAQDAAQIAAIEIGATGAAN